MHQAFIELLLASEVIEPLAAQHVHTHARTTRRELIGGLALRHDILDHDDLVKILEKQVQST